MPQNDKFLHTITEYLNDTSDDALQSEIERFRAESAENERYYLEIERIWNYSARASRLDGVNISASTQRFKENLKPHTSSRSIRLTWFSRVAAAVLVLSIGYWTYLQITEPTYLIKATVKNQLDSLRLTDGSTIILAENSELKYPDKFEGPTREVVLAKGQAFFKIAKDKKHPFKVLMNESEVVVLGTSFNIKLTATNIDLGVKTGRVMFSPYKHGPTSLLTAGQALSYDAKKKEFLTKRAENQDAWLTKELVFSDAPLEEVCTQLTDYYGIPVKLQDHKQSSKKLNARFSNQSLDEVLLVLHETYDFNIKKENNQIILTTPKPIN
ncbi:FecR family protein [Pedobacter nyackensis]|nr:FecR domain-containing protein [Pedobacter nyackensis]